jgi:biopolymer transport protein ExbD
MTIPSQTHAIKIESPGKSLTAPTPPPIVDLTIDFDGALLWNEVPVDRATLQRYIRTEAAKNPRPQVHLRVDKFSKYEVVAQTLADLQRLGLENIGFVDDKPF